MKFYREESGQTLVMVALSMTVLLGFTAFATDVGMMLHEQREAQTAADSAAIAGAGESFNEGNPTTITAGIYGAAAMDAGLNNFNGSGTNGSLDKTTGTTLKVAISPNITVSSLNQAGYVQATVTQSTPSFFMRLFGFKTMNVSATAVASNYIQSQGCINVQNDGDFDPTDTVDMGGNSLITGTACGMTVNGDINMGGNASIVAKFVSASGSISGKNASSTWSEDTGVSTPDPLAKLQMTANQPSKFVAPTNAGLTNGTCTIPVDSGMTCYYDYQGGNLSGTLPSNGVFVFDEAAGPSINGTVTGTNDTIYLVGNIPFDFDNNGTVDITPPGYCGSSTTCTGCIGSTNPYCGILIDAPTDGSGGVNGTSGTYTCKSGKGNNGGNPGELYFDFGSSTTLLYGIVYAPYAQLFTQDKGASATLYTDLVIGNICSQSSTITVDGYSGPQSPLTRYGLVY